MLSGRQATAATQGKSGGRSTQASRGTSAQFWREHRPTHLQRAPGIARNGRHSYSKVRLRDCRDQSAAGENITCLPNHSGALPPITYLDMEKIKRENTHYNHNSITSTLHMSAPPLVSPSIYSGPPPPYSYPSSAASSVVGGGGSGPGAAGTGQGAGNYLSQSETRRTSGDDKEHLPASQRMSLPSISEALTGDQQQQPISISSLLSSSTPQPKFSLVPKSPTSPVGRSYLETYPKGPPDSFPQHTSSSYRPPQPSDRSSGSNTSPRTATSFGECRFPTMSSSHQSVPPPPRTVPSPLHYTRPGVSPIQSQQPYVPPTPLHEKSTRAPHPPPPASNGPFGYSVNNYQPAYTYPPSTPGGPPYRTSTLPPSTWRNPLPEIERVDEMRKAAAKEPSPPRPAYGESVKRHLDIFDLETSLNEVSIHRLPIDTKRLLTMPRLPKGVAVGLNSLAILAPEPTKPNDQAQFQAPCHHSANVMK